jgi:hypothetical protein
VSRVLAPDQMLTMDGRVIAAPEGLVVAAPPPRVDPADARLMDRGVRGENISGLAPARPAPPAAAERPATTAAAPAQTTTATTVTTAAPPQPVAPPSANVSAPLPAAGRGANMPGASGDRFNTPTVFDPNQVNDGSIEAAGTGTRRRAVD